MWVIFVSVVCIGLTCFWNVKLNQRLSEINYEKKTALDGGSLVKLVLDEHKISGVKILLSKNEDGYSYKEKIVVLGNETGYVNCFHSNIFALHETMHAVQDAAIKWWGKVQSVIRYISILTLRLNVYLLFGLIFPIGREIFAVALITNAMLWFVYSLVLIISELDVWNRTYRYIIGKGKFLIYNGEINEVKKKASLGMATYFSFSFISIFWLIISYQVFGMLFR